LTKKGDGASPSVVAFGGRRNGRSRRRLEFLLPPKGCRSFAVFHLLPFEAFFQSIAIPLAVDNVGPVRQPIEESRRHRRISKDLGPVGEPKIRGYDYRPFLLAFGENLKEQFSTFSGKRDVAQFIENEKIPTDIRVMLTIGCLNRPG